jgi:hypothetical protein
MRRTSSTVIGLVATAALLAACGSQGTGTKPATDASSAGVTSSSGTPSSAGTTATPAPTDDAEVPDFPTGTGQQFVMNKGAWDLVLRDVRVGEHEGFDRVVVEFKGNGTPGWGAEYVQTPTADGSGDPVDVSGDNFLAVNISGVIIRAGYPRTPADFFHGPRHFAPENGGSIVDVNLGGVFEGYCQLFLGLDGDQVPFRVFALTNPSRLVIDVKDA